MSDFFPMSGVNPSRPRFPTDLQPYIPTIGILMRLNQTFNLSIPFVDHNLTTLTISGIVNPGDLIQLKLNDDRDRIGFPSYISYVVQVGDTLASIASAIQNTINNNPILLALGIKASVSGAVVSLTNPPSINVLLSGFVKNPNGLAPTESLLIVGPTHVPMDFTDATFLMQVKSAPISSATLLQTFSTETSTISAGEDPTLGILSLTLPVDTVSTITWQKGYWDLIKTVSSVDTVIAQGWIDTQTGITTAP